MRLSPPSSPRPATLLVKQLRAEGQRDEAARVAKLRRPPVSAWALNQVARHQPDLVAAVLEAGDRLRSAMEDAVNGDASGLHRAQAGQRRVVDDAVAAAASYLESAGHPRGDAAHQKMVATLGAAVVDEGIAAALREGVLDQDHDAPGFGLDAASVRVRPSSPGERPRQTQTRKAELEAEADRLAQRAYQLVARAEEAERQAVEARTVAQHATAAAAEARRRADES